MRLEFRTLLRPISTLVVLLTLVLGTSIGASAQGNSRWGRSHNRGRHLGWERGQRVGQYRRDDDGNRLERRMLRRNIRSDRRDFRRQERHERRSFNGSDRSVLQMQQRQERAEFRTRQRGERAQFREQFRGGRGRH